jgi:hypothetical protein
MNSDQNSGPQLVHPSPAVDPARGPNPQAPLPVSASPPSSGAADKPALFPLCPQWSRKLYKSGESTVVNVPPPVCQMLNYKVGDLMIVTPLPIGAMLFFPPDYSALVKHLILNPLLQMCHEVPAEKLASVKLAFSFDESSPPF